MESANGNQAEGSSMPEEEKNPGSRELRKLIDNQEGETQRSNGNWKDSVKMDLFKSFLRPSAGEIVKDDAESNPKTDAESKLSNHCTDHNTCNDSISDIF
jgi:hypothetical protein